MTHPPICPYCGRDAVHVNGRAIYGQRYPHLWKKWFWACWPCEAWVGAHGHQQRAYGTLAKAPLRRLRHQAHQAFDPLWQEGLLPRKEAYVLLAKWLGCDPDLAHIGYLNEEWCRRVIELSRIEVEDRRIERKAQELAQRCF